MEALIQKNYKNIAQKFYISVEQLLQESLKFYLLNRQKEFMNEKLDILSRYTIKNSDELETKIKQGLLVEHPTWEDLIDLKNLEHEIQGIKDDISCL